MRYLDPLEVLVLTDLRQFPIETAQEIADRHDNLRASQIDDVIARLRGYGLAEQVDYGLRQRYYKCTVNGSKMLDELAGRLSQPATKRPDE